jgi:glycosyltransferase involved in cell wall biosynthesis
MIPRLKGKIMLALNYYSFMINGKIWAYFYKKEKFDLIYVYEISPLTMVFPAITYAKRNKIPLIFNVIDLWPDSLEFVNINNKLLLKHFQIVADKAYKKSDLIITTSISFKKKIEERNINSKKIIFIPQYCEDLYKPLSRLECSDFRKYFEDKFNILFTGNIGQSQGLDIVIKALSKIKDNQIVLSVIGEGRAKEDLIKLVKELQLEEKVKFLGKFPMEDIPKLLSFADATIISLKSGGLSDLVIPAKLQSYMACGLPIISCASGELNQIISKANCGLIGNSEDENKLIDNLIKMYNLPIEKRKEMGMNAHKYYKENFVKEKVLNRMEEAFLDTIDSP